VLSADSAHTRVPKLSEPLDMAAKKSGKQSGYTPEEMGRLRALANELHDGGMSDEKLGQLMGMTQQNANRFRRGGGIHRISANRLVAARDFPDAESFLREGGLMAGVEISKKGGKWSAKRAAERIVLEAGFDPDVVSRFLEERSSPADAKHPLKWWLVQLAFEEARHGMGRGP
jgi:hypothetical protein